ncbi:MAG TPA: intradiol ring-cleavage dioxygenase, partial [Polyangiales bacterium]|nr:intradiol ring-cleavage dioxygenase [Polyangiales bacterium]
LRWLAATSVVPLIGCGTSNSVEADGGTSGAGTSGGESGSGTGGGAGSTGTGNIGACTKIPAETGGPFPGDGTNGPNVLTLDGVARRDITSSIGTASGKAEGVPLTVKLNLLDLGSKCVGLGGYAVYIWHCDRAGNYSMYSAGALNENYLRGVQETDDDGLVTFKTIMPGCYAGRWPHIHFEVYKDLKAASSGVNAIATSQLALPKDICDETYATTGYEASVTNLKGVTLRSDGVFSDDGAVHELVTATGSVSKGYVATLDVGVSS